MQRHLSHLAHMICRVTHFEFCILHQLIGFGLELPQAQLLDVLSKSLPEDYESNLHHEASFCTSPLTTGRNARLRCERTSRLCGLETNAPSATVAPDSSTSALLPEGQLRSRMPSGFSLDARGRCPTPEVCSTCPPVRSPSCGGRHSPVRHAYPLSMLF